MSIELVMPSYHLILCGPLFCLLSIFQVYLVTVVVHRGDEKSSACAIHVINLFVSFNTSELSLKLKPERPLVYWIRFTHRMGMQQNSMCTLCFNPLLFTKMSFLSVLNEFMLVPWKCVINTISEQRQGYFSNLKPFKFIKVA